MSNPHQCINRHNRQFMCARTIAVQLGLSLILPLIHQLPAIAQTKTEPSATGMSKTQTPGATGQPVIRSAANPTQKFSERGLARRNLWFPVYSRTHTPVNPTRIRAVSIETQVSSATPMNFPPGWRDDLLSEEQTAGQNERISASGNSSGKLSLRSSLPQGSMLVHQPAPTTIHSAGHEIEIKANAAAYIVNVNNELAVYNLSGDRSRDITVKAPDGTKTYDLVKGHALLLTTAESFADSTLSKFISCSKPWLMASEGNVHVYGARFSYLSALDRCPQFQSCLKSSQKSQRKLADKLLKLSAARIVADSGGQE